MALTGQFAVVAVCPGDGHFTITLAVTPGADVTFTTTKVEAKTPLTVEDKEVFARLLLRASVGQMAAEATGAQIKTAIEAKVFDFTVIG